MHSVKTNYSELGGKFSYKTGRSPREILKEVSAQEPKKKGVFTKSHHKKMVSTTQARKMELRRFRHVNQTLDANGGARQTKAKGRDQGRGLTSGLTRPKNHSFKSETGEFASVSRKNFGKVEYQTSITGNWKGRDKPKPDRKNGAKGKSTYAKRPDKAQLESVMPDCVSIYKKLKVQGMPHKAEAGRKARPNRKDPGKAREAETAKSKKEKRGQSKVVKRRPGEQPLKASVKGTPEKRSAKGVSQKQSKTRSRDPRTRSKRKGKKRSKGKSFEADEMSQKSRVKKSKSRKNAGSFDKKKLTRKNTLQTKKGTSKKKGARPKKAGIRELNPKITQTMSKAERTTSELSSFPKRSLKTSRLIEDSSSHKLREKSQKFLNNNFRNRLRRKDHSRGGKPKTAHSLQKSLRKDSQYSRSKRSQKASKKKKSMVLKNLSELTKGLSGNVKVIYKGEKGRKKGTQGLYTDDRHVFADLKEGVDRDQFMGQRHSKLIYKKGRTSRKPKRPKTRGLRELSHLDAPRGSDEAPNIYSQQKGRDPAQTTRNNARKEDSTVKFINVNEKKVRIWGAHDERSLHKRRKLVSNRKLSGLKRPTQERRSGDREGRLHKSSWKAKASRGDQSVGRDRLMSRDSLTRASVRKVDSQSKLYAQRADPTKPKTNIYQKGGPEFKCPKSEIEFEGRNVQNSIYLKSEEVAPEEGTAISEKTDNSLACQENIGNGLRISQSPQPQPADPERRSRQSTHNIDAEGNTFFERQISGLDYAKSEDLETDRRLPGSKEEVKLSSTKGARNDKPTSLERREMAKVDRKMKLSQSESGNWKSTAKAKFKGVRSGDLGLIR